MTEVTNNASSPLPHSQAKRMATLTLNALEVENIAVGPSSQLKQ
jgi:hypothetical protein